MSASPSTLARGGTERGALPGLAISPEHRRLIEIHASATYPEESCGMLFGRHAREVSRVERVIPAENASPRGTRRHLYLVSPGALARALAEARAAGRELLGFYHSHPDGAARPSERDRAMAWPEHSYVILEVRTGRPAGLRSWRLSADRSHFVEQPTTGGDR